MGLRTISIFWDNGELPHCLNRGLEAHICSTLTARPYFCAGRKEENKRNEKSLPRANR